MPGEIIKAADEGDIDKLKKLLADGGDINEKNANGATPLITAARKDHLGAVQFLLNNGAEIDMRGPIGNTALHIACALNHGKVVRVLLKEGAKYTLRNNLSRTPLLVAAANGHFTIVEILLEAGATLNEKTATGETPLLIAAAAGQLTMFEWLLSKGAKLYESNNAEEGSLQLATKNNRQNIVSFIRKYISKKSKEHRSTTNTKDLIENEPSESIKPEDEVLLPIKKPTKKAEKHELLPSPQSKPMTKALQETSSLKPNENKNKRKNKKKKHPPQNIPIASAKSPVENEFETLVQEQVEELPETLTPKIEIEPDSSQNQIESLEDTTLYTDDIHTASIGEASVVTMGNGDKETKEYKGEKPLIVDGHTKDTTSFQGIKNQRKKQRRKAKLKMEEQSKKEDIQLPPKEFTELVDKDVGQQIIKEEDTERHKNVEAEKLTTPLAAAKPTTFLATGWLKSLEVEKQKKLEASSLVLAKEDNKWAKPENRYYPKIIIPLPIIEVMEQLESSGYVSYLTGDSLLKLLQNQVVTTFELITDASPTTIPQLVTNAIKSYYIDNLYQVTFGYITIDIFYAFKFSPQKDVQKKYFTIQSLYSGKRGNIVDPLGKGMIDFEKRELCLIEDAKDRFLENPWEMLHTARLMADEGLKVTEELSDLIKKYAYLVRGCNIAKLNFELRKHFLLGNAYNNFIVLVCLGLFQALFPYTGEYLLFSQAGLNYKEWLHKKLQQTDTLVYVKQPVSLDYVYALFLLGAVLSRKIFVTSEQSSQKEISLLVNEFLFGQAKENQEHLLGLLQKQQINRIMQFINQLYIEYHKEINIIELATVSARPMV